MTILLYLPQIVLVAGVLIYAISNNAKVMEIGRIMIFCGLLSWLLTVGTK